MEIGELLSKGLEEGYAGGTERQTTQRGSFQMEASHYTGPSGEIYHDEWIANTLGGGQEIVQIGDEMATRLYGGGTAGTEELAQLGLTRKDVTGRLKGFIRESEGKTRTSTPYSAKDGEWQYDYNIIHDVANIPVSVGLEMITYRETTVFAHYFIHSPIK